MARSATHPGEYLGEQLSALDLSASEVGRRLEVPANRISEILKAQRAITGDTALRLGHFFGNNPQFWLNLQTIYELCLAEQKSGELIRHLPTIGSAKAKPGRRRLQPAQKLRQVISRRAAATTLARITELVS